MSNSYKDCKTRKEKGKFITDNINELAEQVKKDGLLATARAWGIGPSTLRYRVYQHLGWALSPRTHKGSPPDIPGGVGRQDWVLADLPEPPPDTPGGHPQLPPFDNNWSPGVQIAWLQAWTKGGGI